MIVYAVLSILLLRAFNSSKNPTFKENAIYLAIIATILYGITDEIHQYFVPGRVFSHFDLLADSVGSFIVLTKIIFDRSKLHSKRQL
jgi:VanZ family protein